MARFPEPCEENSYLVEHATLLLESYAYWTGRRLTDGTFPMDVQARALFFSPFAVASHDTSDDPVLNYGNKTALDLWQLSWNDFTSTPSRQTAETVTQEERSRLLAQVTTHGFIDDYKGVRISATGRRFMIDRATVWNLINGEGKYCGQAAMFRAWRYL